MSDHKVETWKKMECVHPVKAHTIILFIVIKLSEFYVRKGYTRFNAISNIAHT